MMGVIRKVAEMLGLFSASTVESKSFERTARSEAFYYLDELPKRGDLYRRGRHYHVIVGDEAAYWHGSSKFMGPIADHYFNSPEDAHRFFIGLINSFAPYYLSEEDAEESFDELLAADEDHVDHFDEVRPRSGIYFKPMEIKLLVCDSCVPILNN
jgi:hypothetical protein